jgi:hypothetical protein
MQSCYSFRLNINAHGQVTTEKCIGRSGMDLRPQSSTGEIITNRVKQKAGQYARPAGPKLFKTGEEEQCCLRIKEVETPDRAFSWFQPGLKLHSSSIAGGANRSDHLYEKMLLPKLKWIR